MYTFPVFFLAVPVIGLAIIVDVRTGRGYGLGVLSFLSLAFTLLLVITVTLVAFLSQPESIRGFGEHLLVISNSLPVMYLPLAVTLGAAVVAGVVEQWRWLAALVVAALIPALATFLPLPVWYISTNLAVRSIGYVGWNFNPVGTALLAIPQALTLAYSVMRVRRPVADALARQPAPSTGR